MVKHCLSPFLNLSEMIIKREFINTIIDDENKQLFWDKFLMKKEKEETTSLEDYIIYKKTHLLYDWIEGKNDMIFTGVVSTD